MSRAITLGVPSYVVLGLISALGETTPYDMKSLAAVSLDHFRSVRHAQLYSEPQRLADAGYLSHRQEQTGRRRRLYTITAKGEEALAAWIAAPTKTLTEIRDEAVLKLFFGADPVATAAQQIELHQARLKDFEETAQTFAAQMTTGQRLSLRIGIQVEQHWLSVLADVAAGVIDGEP
jgi:PadR family transcriptional regulator AphA